jgi:hypothetical protein
VSWSPAWALDDVLYNDNSGDMTLASTEGLQGAIYAGTIASQHFEARRSTTATVVVTKQVVICRHQHCAPHMEQRHVRNRWRQQTGRLPRISTPTSSSSADPQSPLQLQGIIIMAISVKYFITDPNGNFIDWNQSVPGLSILGQGGSRS